MTIKRFYFVFSSFPALLEHFYFVFSCHAEARSAEASPDKYRNLGKILVELKQLLTAFIPCLMNFQGLQERLEQGDNTTPQDLRDKVSKSSEKEVRDWIRGSLPLWETSPERPWDFDDAPEEGLFASKIGNLVWNALMEESKKPLIAYALGLMCWEGGERYNEEGITSAILLRQ